ncbi:MAG: hypothetical protein ACRDRN_11855 [Sciscionella sp.]
MATSAAMRAFSWGDGVQVAAQDLRLGQISALLGALGGSPSNALGVGSGVRHGVGSPLFVAVVSGLSVTVNPGFAIVQGTAAANSGAYACTLDAASTLTCATADLVNPRIDSMIVQVVDNGNATSTATVNIQTGTPASSPTPPALPANSLLLCNITVAANATSLTAGNLSDQRNFLAAAGGIQPVISSSFYPTTGPQSAYAHDISIGRLLWFNGTRLQAPKTAAFAPVSASGAGATANSATYVTLASVSVAVDGVTPVHIDADISFFGFTGGIGNGFQMAILRDGGTSKALVFYITQTTNLLMDGRSMWQQDTPSSGTHTYAVAIATQGGGTITAHNANILVQAVSP